MKTLILFLGILALMLLKNDFCLGQYKYGWKKISDISYCIEFLDTLNIKTYYNKTYFFIKQEYPDSDFKKRNINHRDSTYRLFSVDTTNPSINSISTVNFYSNGTIMLNMSEPGLPLGPDLLKYGLGNMVYEEYYRLVTGKSLIGFPIKKDDGN